MRMLIHRMLQVLFTPIAIAVGLYFFVFVLVGGVTVFIVWMAFNPRLRWLRIWESAVEFGLLPIVALWRQ